MFHQLDFTQIEFSIVFRVKSKHQASCYSRFLFTFGLLLMYLNGRWDDFMDETKYIADIFTEDLADSIAILGALDPHHNF